MKPGWRKDHVWIADVVRGVERMRKRPRETRYLDAIFSYHGHFQNSRDDHGTTSHAATVVIWMTVQHIERFQKPIESSLDYREGMFVKQPFELMKLDHDNSKARKRRAGNVQ